MIWGGGDLQWGEICNGGRSAMVFQHQCRSSGGGLQYNTGVLLCKGNAYSFATRRDPLDLTDHYCPYFALTSLNKKDRSYK